MNKKKFLSIMLMAAATTVATAQVTPYGWRGPEHNGYYPDKGLLNQSAPNWYSRPRTPARATPHPSSWATGSTSPV